MLFNFLCIQFILHFREYINILKQDYCIHLEIPKLKLKLELKLQNENSKTKFQQINSNKSGKKSATGLLHPGAHLEVPGGRLLRVQPDDELELQRGGGAQDGAPKMEGELVDRPTQLICILMSISIYVNRQIQKT